MKKRTAMLGAAFAFLAFFVVPSVSAVPIMFFDPDHGNCSIVGHTETHWLYECEDGSLLYIAK